MTTLFPAFGAGWLLTVALLIIEHLLWKDAPRLVRYLLGGGTLCLGCSVTGAIIEDAILGVGPWVIGSAGMVIVLMTWLDEQRETRDKHARTAGHIAATARDLTQELIDDPRHRRN